jgi:UDP-glucose 4-epimerase
VDVITTGRSENVNPLARFYEVDIRSKDLEKVFEKENPEIVYHLAAQSAVSPSVKDPLYDESVNVGGTVNVLEMMRKYGAKKIIYPSSAAANIYGPRQIPEGEGGVISIFTDQIKNGETPKINGDGEHTRDFIYVGDVAQANLEAMNKGSQMVLNISTGEAVSVLELLQCMEEATGQSIEAIHREERLGDIVHSCLQPTLAQESLGWKATTSLLDGLKQTINSSS